MPSPLIAIPTRDQLEELFPTTGNVQLDDRARTELRTVTAFHNMLQWAIQPLKDLNMECRPHDPDNRNADYHYLRLTAEYTQACNSGEIPNHPLRTAEAALWFASRLARTNEEEIEYAWRSIEATGAAHHYLQQSVTTVDVIDSEMSRPIAFVFAVIMNAHGVRRYPHIRFRPNSFLRYVLHFNELDSEGVPRVSLDGYKLEPSLVKI